MNRFFNFEALKAFALASFSVFVIAGVSRQFQRANDIKFREPIDNSPMVFDAEEFQTVGKPHHGSLPAAYVQHKETGNEYVQKGAHSREDLVKEVMDSNALHEISPDQPECLIMQTKTDRGYHYHTLSRRFNNTEDLEDFVRKGRAGELLTKHTRGLGLALISDQILGKHADIKLANMIVRNEGDSTNVVASIDHEQGITPTRHRFFSFVSSTYPTTPRTIVNGINDLYEPDEQNRSGLAGDERAKEFGRLAESIIKADEITDAYKRIAETDLSPVIEQCTNLAKASRDGLFRQSDCDAYQRFFREIQDGARTRYEELLSSADSGPSSRLME